MAPIWVIYILLLCNLSFAIIVSPAQIEMEVAINTPTKVPLLTSSTDLIVKDSCEWTNASLYMTVPYIANTTCYLQLAKIEQPQYFVQVPVQVQTTDSIVRNLSSNVTLHTPTRKYEDIHLQIQVNNKGNHQEDILVHLLNQTQTKTIAAFDTQTLNFYFSHQLHPGNHTIEITVQNITQNKTITITQAPLPNVQILGGTRHALHIRSDTTFTASIQGTPYKIYEGTHTYAISQKSFSIQVDGVILASYSHDQSLHIPLIFGLLMFSALLAMLTKRLQKNRD
ncbi:MAG: hypothetical protein ACMXYF_03915 [Candidatus Woesearchaeota archaeon]